MIRLWVLAATIVSAWFLAACGNSGKSSAEPAETARSKAGQPGGSPAPRVEESAAGASSKPFKLADIFPAGKGRELVLDTCGSCHPVACAALGQRAAESWDAIKNSHADKLVAHSSANVNAMFSYLKTNFNETKPEPKIPAELVQQGCTPF